MPEKHPGRNHSGPPHGKLRILSPTILICLTAGSTCEQPMKTRRKFPTSMQHRPKICLAWKRRSGRNMCLICKKADYCTYPRLGAIAEIAWTAPENRSWAHFQQKLEDYYRLLSVYGVEHPATLKQAMPGALRAKGYSLWFNRRQLHWAGLHNLIDDAKVKKVSGKATTLILSIKFNPVVLRRTYDPVDSPAQKMYPS